MEPTLSAIYWGVCADHVTSGTLESALMYFKPREVLTAGALSPEVGRLVAAFVGASPGSTLEALPPVAEARTVRLQVCALREL